MGVSSSSGPTGPARELVFSSQPLSLWLWGRGPRAGQALSSAAASEHMEATSQPENNWAVQTQYHYIHSIRGNKPPVCPKLCLHIHFLWAETETKPNLFVPAVCQVFLLCWNSNSEKNRNLKTKGKVVTI